MICSAYGAMQGADMDSKVETAAVALGSVKRKRNSLPMLKPLAIALALQAVISIEQIDLAWSGWLYAREGHHWALRDSWLLSDLIHIGGRHLSIGLLVVMVALFALSRLKAGLRPWRRVLGYLVVAPVTASALVALGKQLTGVECPWSLQPFGGADPYVPLLRHFIQGGGEGACFPAGHASAGYAWFALYFAARSALPHRRHAALAIGLGSGLLFGLSQQLRGAHFLSHDLWSLVLCWYTTMLLARLMLPKPDGSDAV